MKRVLWTALIVVGTPLAAFFVLLASVEYVFYRPSSIEWRPYPSPPEGAAQLMTTTERFDLYVRARSGRFYNCHQYDGCTPIDEDEIVYSDDLCGRAPRFEAPAAPGIVVDAADYVLCGTDVSIQESFAVLDDGAIWIWTTGWGWGDGLLSIMYVVAGTAITFLATCVALFVVRRRKRKGRSPASRAGTA